MTTTPETSAGMHTASTLSWIASCFLLFAGLIGTAQTTLIPDANFEQYLIDQGWDSDGTVNGQVLTADIEGITSLSIMGSSYPVSNLVGLEDFTALESLSVAQQLNLHSINVSQCPNLEVLRIPDSGIYAVDVSNNPSLRVFDAVTSSVGNMDFSNNPLMEEIEMYFTNASQVTLGTHPNLTSFSLYSSSNFGTAAAYDFSGSPLLESLTLEFQENLTSLELTQNTALSYLRLVDCGFSDLDLSGCSSLQDLTVTTDWISSSLTSLDVRNGNNGALTDVDLRFNPNLLCVKVDDGPAAESNQGVYASWQHGPAVMFGNSCELTYVPGDNFEQFLIDQGYDNQLNNYVHTDNIATVTELSIYGSNYEVTNMTGLQDFQSLESLALAQQLFLHAIDVTQCPNLEVLRIPDTGIYNVDVSNNPALRVFDAVTSSVGNMDFSNNPLLEEIDMYFTYASQVTLGTHPNLTSFSLYSSSNLGTATTYDFSGSPLLASLTLEEQENLTALDLSQNPGLTNLILRDCALESLDLRNANNGILTSADLRFNPNLLCVAVDDGAAAQNNEGAYAGWQHSTEVTFRNSCELTYVPDDDFEQYLINIGADDVLDDYVITENIADNVSINLTGGSALGLYPSNLIGIEDFANLRTLDLYNVPGIGNLDLSNNTLLEYINVSSSGAIIAHLDNNTKLRRLYANDCSIGGLQLDLSHCPDLEEVALLESSVAEVILGNHPNLTRFWMSAWGTTYQTSLDLSGSPLLNTLELREFHGLETLDLSANPNLETFHFYTNEPTAGGLTHLNLHNGNNEVLEMVSVYGYQNLSCVLVDHPEDAQNDVGPYAGWTHDTGITFHQQNCDETYVPDASFRQYLLDEGLTHSSPNHFWTEDLWDLTSLSIGSEYSLWDLTGIQDMVNLTWINLTDHEYLTFEMGYLEQFNSLTSLSLRYPYFPTNDPLDFSVCPTLDFLQLQGVSGVVDVSNNPGLNWLLVSGGDFGADLILGNNTNLESLYFYYQREDGFNHLDLSQCGSLKYVLLDQLPYMDELDFTTCPALRELRIEYSGELGAGLDLDFSQSPLLNQVHTAWSGYSGVNFPSNVNSINLQNGNNTLLTDCVLHTLAPSMCVAVDDASAADLGTGAYASWNVQSSVNFSSVISGCSDPAACNYLPEACQDDGSCQYISGCTNPMACNYNPGAFCDDGSCVLSPENDWCDQAVPLTEGEVVWGDNTNACHESSYMDCAAYTNRDVWYSVTSQTGGTITVEIVQGTIGWLMASAYPSCDGDALVCDSKQIDAPSVLSFPTVCGETYLVQVSHYQPGDEGTFTITYTESNDALQCNDPAACSYNPCATSDVACTYPGCTNPTACNFDVNAGCDDGSCTGANPDNLQQFCLYDYNADCAADGNLIHHFGAWFEPGLTYDQTVDGAQIVSVALTVFGASCEPTTMTLSLNGEAFFTETQEYCAYQEARVFHFLASDLPPMNGDQQTIQVTWDNNIYLGAVLLDVTTAEPLVEGCTDPSAANYNDTANCDDGLCMYSGCAEDLNGDGQVGTSDLLMILGEFGSTCVLGAPCPLDISGDAEVGTSDLLAVLAVFSTTCP